MSIAQNTALFSLLGTTYGGDGRTTFNLPDLQGATAIGQGQGPGLAQYSQGQVFANQTPTLTTSQLPTHTHLVPASVSAATSSSPVGLVPAVASATNVNGEAVAVAAYAPTPNVSQAPGALGSTGSSAAVGIQSPFLVLNYCIALQGVFPSRP
jgi:microcystin-dependent protein